MVFVGLLTLSTAHAAVSFSPQNGGSGAIPNGHPDIEFVVKDGRWTKNLTLPSQPRDGDIVVVKSEATYDTYINGSNTYIRLPTLLLKKGQYFKFKYNASKKEWTTLVSNQYPINESNETTVKISTNNATSFIVENGRWTNTIVLPNRSDEKFVFIHSNAEYLTNIKASGKYYKLTKGQAYLFKSANGKWKIVREF